MTLALLLLIAADYGTAANGAKLPDPVVTPGAILTTDARKVCVPGYSKSVRNVPNSIKKLAYKKYHVKPKPGVCCEVDHLISLELGGSNDISNLWPEPYEPRPNAHEKDAVENALHAAVCAGQMTLPEAQKAIAKDWTAAVPQ